MTQIIVLRPSKSSRDMAAAYKYTFEILAANTSKSLSPAIDEAELETFFKWFNETQFTSFTNKGLIFTLEMADSSFDNNI